MINLKLAEYNLETGRFKRFLELGKDFGYFGDYIAIKYFAPYNDFVGQDKVNTWCLNELKKDQKDPLNRFNGLFDGRTYGEGKFVLIRSSGNKDLMNQEIFEDDLFYYTCPEDDLERLIKITYCYDKMGFEAMQICEGQEDPLWSFVDGWETYETPKYLKTIEVLFNLHENPELYSDNDYPR